MDWGMGKARYLAPWHQDDLMEMIRRRDGEVDVGALEGLRGKPAIYHCVSRVVDRRFAFGQAEKEQFVRYMRLYERFGQVRVLSFCIMSNHFHILLEVPARPEDGGVSWSDAKLLKHLAILYSGAKLREIKQDLARFREQGNEDAAEELRNSFLCRMWDLSQFMKSLKQRFSRWFNKLHDRTGTLWEKRFGSTLVESGLAARAVAGYIDLNPVRAKMVERPEDYRWCGFSEAVAGRQRAREGIQRVMYERELSATNEERASEMLSDWRKVARLYRKLLCADILGLEQEDEEATERGAAEASLPLREQVASRRIRHFTEGLVIGTQQFLNELFSATRAYFGPARKSGARRMRGQDMGWELCSMRDLQE